MNSRILLVISICYPTILLLLGVHAFFFLPTDVGYAPNPQESFFFAMTSFGSLTVIVFFIVIGVLYWRKTQNPKTPLIILPFLISIVILLLLFVGYFPKGAEA